MKLVCESIDEAMIMSNNRQPDTDEDRYVGTHIPQSYKDKFMQMMTPRQKRKSNANILFKQAHLGTCKTIRELIALEPQDNDWVIRSMDGTGELLLFDGDMVDKEGVNELKAFYKNAQDKHYFDARPITYARWKTLPPKFKIASQRDPIGDFQEN
jgi:hypothetical protein